MTVARATMLTAAFAVSLAGCGGPSTSSRSPIDVSRLDEAWDANNDPLRLRDQFETTFAALPLKGEAARVPWTDSYWPSYRAGIADRWNDPTRPDPFSYRLKDFAELGAMSRAELATLSPAEKYDLFKGRDDFLFVSSERKRTSPEDPRWFGLCHGWAPAAIAFEEPKPVTLVGRTGVAIPFGSSDVKALLLYMQQYGRYGGTRFLGARCNADLSTNPEAALDPQCRDVNAGSFHVVIANQLGIDKAAFVADVTRDHEVWNQPVHAFDSRVLSESGAVYASAAPGTVKIVEVETRMRYVVEMAASWEPRPVELYPMQVQVKRLRYALELDAEGRIIGGEWRQHDRPDFLWTQTPGEFQGYFAELKEIYEASIR